MAAAADDGPGAPGPTGRWDHRADGTPVRLVTDPATARTWRVWAAATAHVPGAPAGDRLMFDAGDVVRGVWGAPPGWAALSDAALLALAEASAGGPHRVPDRPVVRAVTRDP